MVAPTGPDRGTDPGTDAQMIGLRDPTVFQLRAKMAPARTLDRWCEQG